MNSFLNLCKLYEHNTSTLQIDRWTTSWGHTTLNWKYLNCNTFWITHNICSIISHVSKLNYNCSEVKMQLLHQSKVKITSSVFSHKRNMKKKSKETVKNEQSNWQLVVNFANRSPSLQTTDNTMFASAECSLLVEGPTIYTVSQKTVQTFLPELHQISINCENTVFQKKGSHQTLGSNFVKS